MPENQTACPESHFLIRRILCDLEGVGVTTLHPLLLKKAHRAQISELAKRGVTISNQKEEALEEVLEEARKRRFITSSRQTDGYPIYFGFTIWKNSDQMVRLNGTGEAVKIATRKGVDTYSLQCLHEGRSFKR